MMVRAATDDVRFLLNIYEKMMEKLSKVSLWRLAVRSELYCRCFCLNDNQFADWSPLPPVPGQYIQDFLPFCLKLSSLPHTKSILPFVSSLSENVKCMAVIVIRVYCLLCLAIYMTLTANSCSKGSRLLDQITFSCVGKTGFEQPQLTLQAQSFVNLVTFDSLVWSQI